MNISAVKNLDDRTVPVPETILVTFATTKRTIDDKTTPITAHKHEGIITTAANKTSAGLEIAQL